MKFINKKLENRKWIVVGVAGYIYISMLFNGYANNNVLSIDFWKSFFDPYFTSEVIWVLFIYLFIYLFIIIFK